MSGPLDSKWLTISAALAMGSNKITGLAAGSAAGDAVTYDQLLALLQGLKVKDSVRVATAAALPAYTQAGAGAGATLTADANGALTIDGVAVAAGDRVAQQHGAANADNGIYTVTDAGDAGSPYILTRATDMDADAEVFGAVVKALQGTANAGKTFFVASFGGTIDTNDIVWTEEPAGSVVGGDGIDVSGGTVSADLKASGGLKIDAGELAVEPTDFAGTGLEDDGDKLRLAAPGNGLTGGAGSAYSVQAADTSVSVGVGGVKSAVTKIQSETLAGGSSGEAAWDTGIDIGEAPAAGSAVRVVVIGAPPMEVGDGAVAGNFFFSSDGGSTALAQGSITNGASLYYRAAATGVELEAGEKIELHYVKAG